MEKILRLCEKGVVDGTFPWYKTKDVTDNFIVGYDIINTEFAPEKAALFTSHPKQLQSGDAFLLFSREITNGQELSEKFSRGLKKLIESGRYDEIVDEILRNNL